MYIEENEEEWRRLIIWERNQNSCPGLKRLVRAAFFSRLCSSRWIGGEREPLCRLGVRSMALDGTVDERRRMQRNEDDDVEKERE